MLRELSQAYIEWNAATPAVTDVGIGAMDRVRMMHRDIAGVSLNQPVNVPVQFTDEIKV